MKNLFQNVRCHANADVVFSKMKQDVVAMACLKPDKPELDGLRREGVTPTQTVGAYLNLETI